MVIIFGFVEFLFSCNSCKTNEFFIIWFCWNFSMFFKCETFYWCWEYRIHTSVIVVWLLLWFLDVNDCAKYREKKPLFTYISNWFIILFVEVDAKNNTSSSRHFFILTVWKSFFLHSLYPSLSLSLAIERQQLLKKSSGFGLNWTKSFFWERYICER